MFLTSKREAVQWIHDAWRFKHGDRCVKFNQTPWWHVSFKFLQFQFRITSIQTVSFLIFFPILFWLCGNIPYSFFFFLNKNYWIYVYFFRCYFFCVQNAYAISVDIFWRLLSCQDNWEMFNLLSIFISYVLLSNTVFVKTFLWSEFLKICLHG